MTHLRTLAVLGGALLFGACASAGQGHTASTTLTRGHCAGLSSEDQDISAFYAADNVRRVEPVYRDTESTAPRTRSAIRRQPQYLAGATMYVRAPEASSAFVERVLSCHAAKGAEAADHPNDPLRVAGIRSVDVHQAGPHLGISIVAENPEAGRNILRRAEAMHSQPSTVQVKQVAAIGSGAQL